jgi:orotidine-5'-phosphate decarboxylase
VLTSLSAEDLRTLGFAGTPAEAALRLARVAVKAGADGLVCSPEEVGHLRRELGPGPLLVVPGIRPAGAASGDQRRTGTPRSAIEAGASHIVVGRPLRDSPDPAAAADSIAADLDA